MSDGNLVRTALYENHLQAGANIVDFHGFELPIWYSSIQEEHTSCRSESGLFDVSHMGSLELNQSHIVEIMEALGTPYTLLSEFTAKIISSIM